MLTILMLTILMLLETMNEVNMKERTEVFETCVRQQKVRETFLTTPLHSVQRNESKAIDVGFIAAHVCPTA